MKRPGQAYVAFILLLPVALLVIALVIGGGRLVYQKIRLQNAADGAAYTAALWQSRGLNCIADLNWALLAAEGGEAASLNWDFKISRAISDSQGAALKAFPGVAALAMYDNFAKNNAEGKCLPLIAGLSDARMFSLRLRKKEKLLFIERDTPDYWVKQEESGPVIRVICNNPPGDFPLSGLLGRSLPELWAVAAALPALAGDSDTSVPLFGDLWIPGYYPRLTAVNIKIPFINRAVLH